MLWALLCGTVAVGRCDLLADRPELGLPVPVVRALLVGLGDNLIAILRSPDETSKPGNHSSAIPANAPAEKSARPCSCG